MTTPSERTRALRWAGEFLREIQASANVDADLKREARVILRHFPSESEIRTWAASCSAAQRDRVWLAPESEPDKAKGEGD